MRHLILALAASSLSGVVHDSTGGAVSGAAVIVAPASGAERADITGPDGRFTIETPGHRRGDDRRPRRRLRREDAEGVASRADPIEITVEPATLLETVTVTPTRTEQRLGDVPASVNVLTSEEIQASPALRRRRRAAAGADVQPVPPHQQPRRRSRRRRACRCAASGRAARAGRSCCSTACRSTIRSAAGCTGRACRSSASIASRSPRTRRRACTATTRWAASSTSSPAGRRGGRSSSSRSTATATARSSTSSPATVEQGRRRRRRQLLQHRRLSDRRGERARADRQQRQRQVPERHRQARLHADRARSTRSSAPAISPRIAINGKVGEVNDTRWTTRERRRPRAAAGRQRPAGARVRRRRGLALQLPGGHQRGDDAQHRPPGDRSARADQRRRRHGAVDEGRSAARTSSAPAPTGAGWTATARRTRTSPPVPTSIAGVTQAATLSVQRVSGGTQQSLGAFVQDIFTPMSKAGGHAERARRSLAELRRPQPRDHGGDRPADGQQSRRRFPTRATRSSARASRRCITSRIA